MAKSSGSRERLNRYLARCGVSSRRGADELIDEGRVKVNGRTVTEHGVKIDPAKDSVQVGKRKIYPQAAGVILFHKPKNVISSLSDPERRPCVADFLSRKEEGYFPVGRLDFDSTGLLILTNDGDLADRLLHPRYQIPREYEVRVAGLVSEKILRRITRGVRLSDGIVKGEAKVLRTLSDATWLRITLSSGRNRVIRRLMEHLRHPVSKLHRVSHGPFKLGNVKRGELHRLSDDHYSRLRGEVFGE